MTGLNENHLMAMDVINMKLNFNKSFEVLCQPFATCELQVSELVAHFKELIDMNRVLKTNQVEILKQTKDFAPNSKGFAILK